MHAFTTSDFWNLQAEHPFEEYLKLRGAHGSAVGKSLEFDPNEHWFATRIQRPS
jgi:hypothetical protein